MALKKEYSLKYYVLSFLAFPGVALANEATEILNTDTILLDAIQVISKAEDPPPDTTVVEKKTLDKLLIKDMSDLSNRLEPGVNYNRTTQSINIRGLEQDRVLTTVDGIRVPYLNDRIRGEKGGLDSLDFSSLSQLDINRSPNEDKSGLTSLGGSLSLYTLNPEDLLSGSKKVGGIIKSDYDTADRSYGINGALAGKYGDTQVLIQAGKRQGHELRHFGSQNIFGVYRSKANPEDDKQNNFLFKLKQQLTPEHSIGFTGEQFTKIKDINLRSNQGTTFAQNLDSNKEKTQRQRLSMDYHYKSLSQNSLIDQANGLVYWQSSERSNKQEAYRIKIPVGDYMRENKLKQEMFGLSGDISKSLNLGGVDQKITLGSEWFQTHTRQFSEGRDNCPTFSSAPSPWNPLFPTYMACSSMHSNMSDMPKAQGQQVAIYLKNEITLVSDKVTLTPSIRYDYYRFKPKTGSSYSAGKILSQSSIETNKDSHWSGGLLLKWQIQEQISAYAQWSQGFRSPDPTELYINFINSGVGYATLGNSNLKPETSNNFELGLDLGNDKLGGSINVFYSNYKNFIDSISVDNTTMLSLGLDPSIYKYGVDRWENRSKVKIYGSEVTAHWQFQPNWKLWGNVAWAVGKDRETNQYLNTVAPVTGLVGLEYQRETWGADLTLKTAAKRTKVENKTDFRAPGYGVIDLSLFWKPSAVKGLTLQAGAFNLTNKKYWNALNVPSATNSTLQPYDYYTEPKRSFRLSMSYQF